MMTEATFDTTDATYVETTMSSPIGNLRIIGSESGVRAVLWPNERQGRVTIGRAVVADTDGRLEPAVQQLEEYFAGQRREFTLPLVVRGTDFQRTVWRHLAEIPYGRTTTYGELARAIDRPNAARAVGAATGLNPLSILIPCHRLVGSGGSLTGFAGGLDAKRWLLHHERSDLQLF